MQAIGFPGAFASAAKIVEDRAHPIFFRLKGARRRWSKVDANALLAIEGCFENNRRSKINN